MAWAQRCASCSRAASTSLSAGPKVSGQPFPAELTRRLVRYEPLALLILADHPLAALDAVPLERLHGMEIDASSGNTDAPEWVDLAESLAAEFGARPSAPHTHVVGWTRPPDTSESTACRSSP